MKCFLLTSLWALCWNIAGCTTTSPQVVSSEEYLSGEVLTVDAADRPTLVPVGIRQSAYRQFNVDLALIGSPSEVEHAAMRLWGFLNSNEYASTEDWISIQDESGGSSIVLSRPTRHPPKRGKTYTSTWNPAPLARVLEILETETPGQVLALIECQFKSVSEGTLVPGHQLVLRLRNTPEFDHIKIAVDERPRNFTVPDRRMVVSMR